MSAESKRGSRRWIVYFLILAVLTAISVTVLIGFNQHQQLREEQLDYAFALWREHGPRDYDLEYKKLLDDANSGEGPRAEWYTLQVRHGEVTKAELNGKPLEERLYDYYAMPGLFHVLEGFLKEDAKPGARRQFMRANFDPIDGHIKQFIRRWKNLARRLQIDVTLTRVGN